MWITLSFVVNNHSKPDHFIYVNACFFHVNILFTLIHIFIHTIYKICKPDNNNSLFIHKKYFTAFS